MNPLSKMDDRKSWVIALACSFIAFCNTGIYRSSSVLYVEMIKTMSLTRESASWPFSLFGAVSHFTGILPGLMSSHFSIRHFVFLGAILSTLGVFVCFFSKDIVWISVSFGVIAGFGSGLIMTLLPVVINSHFKSNRATANGIFLSGATVSLLLLPSLTEWLVHLYALRGTYLLLSGLVLNVLVGAMFLHTPSEGNGLLRKPEVSQSETEVNRGKSEVKPINPEIKPGTLYDKPAALRRDHEFESDTFLQLREPELRPLPLCRTVAEMVVKCGQTMMNPMFILITFCSVTTRTVIVTVSLILVDYVMDRGETEIRGILLVSMVAVPELVGRLGSGWISDHKFLQRKHVFLLSEVASGVCLCLLTIVHSQFLIFSLCALFALANGGAFILVNVFYLEYLGLERLPVALGLKNLFTGLASLTRPWFIGLFRDRVRSYDMLFQALGGISFLAGVIWLLEPIITKNSKDNYNQPNTNSNDGSAKC